MRNKKNLTQKKKISPPRIRFFKKVPEKQKINFLWPKKNILTVQGHTWFLVPMFNFTETSIYISADAHACFVCRCSTRSWLRCHGRLTWCSGKACGRIQRTRPPTSWSLFSPGESSVSSTVSYSFSFCWPIDSPPKMASWRTSFVGQSILLTYDHPNGFTYLQLGRDFINLFLFKYMAF